MAESNGVAVWITRFGVVLDLLNKLSLTTVLMIFIGFGISVYTGWVPSPLARESTLTEHANDGKKLVAAWVVTDTQLSATLVRLTELVAEQARRNRIRDCAEIKDLELRRECLR